MLPPDNLGWLDEGIRRSDESGDGGGDDGSDGSDGGVGGHDEETYGVGRSQQGGTMTWNSNYYVTQNTFRNSIGIWISWLI